MIFHDACTLCLVDYVGVCCLACSVLQLTWALLSSHFAKHCRLHRYLQLFPRVFNGFLALSIFPIDGINASQTSDVIELWCFNGPLPLLLFLSCLRHVSPNFRPPVIRSDSCLHLCESPSRATHILEEVACLVTWQISIHVDISIVVNTFFLQHIQICVSRGSTWWRQNEVSFPWQKSLCGLRRHLLFLSVGTLPSFLEVLLWEIFTPDWMFPPWSGFSDSMISSKQFCCSICGREFKNCSPLLGVNTSFALSHQAWISDVSKFPAPQCLLPKCLLSKLLPACNAYLWNIPGKYFVPNWWSLDWSCAEIGWYSPIAPNGTTGPLIMVLRNVLHQVCSHLPGSWTYRKEGLHSTEFRPSQIKQHCKCPFLYSAYRSFRNNFCLGSAKCWSTMIPW